MDAILISANPSLVMVDDAIRHLAEHAELYWEVGFQIVRNDFSYPIYGFMHIKGAQVEYRATIKDIIPFAVEHYENKELAEQVKPSPWLQEWKDNTNNIRLHPWKNALVITEIVPFTYNTYSFKKYDGTPVKRPPQGYARVLLPGQEAGEMIPRHFKNGSARGNTLAERNLEEFVIHQLDMVEPGLRLEKRQLATPAGRLDLLCKDAEGNYVVVELKRTLGTDQVMGQILRYMGWLSETHGIDKVRGIVVVAKKDQALTYAMKAAPNVQVKEFKLSVE